MSSMESSEVQEQQRRWEKGVAAGLNSGEAAAYAEGRLELPAWLEHAQVGPGGIEVDADVAASLVLSLSYTALRHVHDDGSTVAEYAVSGDEGDEVIFSLHDLRSTGYRGGALCPEVKVFGDGLATLRGLPLDDLLADVPSAEVFELRLEQAGVREEAS